jgi:hypothetical protein
MPRGNKKAADATLVTHLAASVSPAVAAKLVGVSEVTARKTSDLLGFARILLKRRKGQKPADSKVLAGGEGRDSVRLCQILLAVVMSADALRAARLRGARNGAKVAARVRREFAVADDRRYGIGPFVIAARAAEWTLQSIADALMARRSWTRDASKR